MPERAYAELTLQACAFCAWFCPGIHPDIYVPLSDVFQELNNTIRQGSITVMLGIDLQCVTPLGLQPRRPSNAFTSRRPKTSRARVSAPPQALFGTKQASAGKEQYLCIDCGYIYDGR